MANDQNPYEPPREHSEPLVIARAPPRVLARTFWIGIAMFSGGLLIAFLIGEFTPLRPVLGLPVASWGLLLVATAGLGRLVNFIRQDCA